MKVHGGMRAVALAMALGAGSAIGEDAMFLKAPRHIGPPAALHAVTNRAFQGISSMAVSPGGRLWATWYAGVTPGEDHNNYVVLSTSGDNGRTWREIMVVDPDEDNPLRTFDPELWTDPDGRLWWIWAQAESHGTGAHTWALVAENPDKENPSWSKPRRLAPGVMMCKPIVLRDGTWAFPISDWEGRRLKTPEAATAGLWASSDKGASFEFRGATLSPVEDRNFDEHMFIERRDGSIWMLVRTRYGIGESVSVDGGRTWSELVPLDIPHPTARFFITRLLSGNLLLVKHGLMTERSGRSHLMAFVSTDDGKSWGGGFLIDERTGVSYPDGQQAADGTIVITYDFSRTGDRHILMAAFREEDAAAGKAVSGAVRLNQLISEASGGQEKPRPPAATPRSAKADRPAPEGVYPDAELLKGFVHPPVQFAPSPEYGPDKRNYQGIPTIERAPNGRIWAGWYAGKVWEDKYNYVLAATSGDDGKTWSDVKFVIDPDGDDDRRASDPCFWLDPTGKLWLFWWMNGGGLHVTLAITTDNPNDENPVWTEPRALFAGVMINKPIVLKNGDWLMPAAIWKQDHSARVLISKDQGKSFTLQGAANIPEERRNCDEHMIVEKKDGSLMMLVRTAEHGIGQSLSTDGGRTWSDVVDYLFDATARFHLRRLASGNLLLVKHGPLNERIRRSHLTAYLSEDDGETWIGGLTIDERNSVSYPDATQAPDGRIHLIYDWERARDKHILMATFTEGDVRTGAFSPGGRERVLINFATGINPKLAAQEKERAAALALNDNADAASFIDGPRADVRAADGSIRDFVKGALLFNDRDYAMADVTAALKGRRFVVSSIDGVRADCVADGVVYILTPVPDRNKDSVEAQILRQGFVKAAVPELPLWGSGPANVCSVYQKAVKAGETIEIGKWGVLVF